ncbi:MAG: UvrD-helicase domain-containing protein [Arenicella sp.]
MKFPLNDQQNVAVKHLDAPLLVLAGAGSGKTRVITQKIIWLIQDKGVSAKSIFAVTFTNKAAREMKERVSETLDKSAAKGLTVSTFHSLGLQILREEREALNLNAGFSIFDPNDSRVVVRDLMRQDYDADDELIDGVRHFISKWKNDLVGVGQAQQLAMTDAMQVTASRVYEAYERHLHACNAVDLDDLIKKPIDLFRRDDEVLGRWRERVQYLLVDEYQDTNAAQYELVRFLVGQGAGLTAVGDDDQSIYGWRGAQPDNLVQLGKDFPALELVKLEQNYRSMGRILHTANHLIQKNQRPFEKHLWSELGFGEPIRVLTSVTESQEAEKVVADLMSHKFQKDSSYGDYAILYRGNHQARAFETRLREMQIPYYLSGGLSFFERAEIKDVMSYLRVLTNPKDDNAFVRCINTPRRGIGAGAIEKVGDVARAKNVSLYEAIVEDALQNELSQKRIAPLRSFSQWIEEYKEREEEVGPLQIVSDMLEHIDYHNYLMENSKSPEQAEMRWKNVMDLVGWVKRMYEKDNEKTLTEIVANMALMGILEKNDDEQNDNQVSLMTLHASKGLEFPYVYIVGLEENLLPHKVSVEEGGIEEERRLFYVGITRARHELVLSYAKQRQRFGELIQCEPSRFLEELDQDHLDWQDKEENSEEEELEMGRANIAALKAMLNKS